MIEINNRRYIGGKTKLLSHIKNAVYTSIDGDFTFADLFSGTGVVAYEFATLGHKTIVNDILYSNVVAYKAWFSNEPYSEEKLQKSIDLFNSLEYNSIQDNYLSTIYGDKYFSNNDAKKIGYIREYLEEHKDSYTDREYYILLTSLLYAADRIANTVGHYESFLKAKPIDSNIQMQMLDLKNVPTAEIYNADVNDLAPHIEADVVYLDPPYNARQYVNFYHVLENIARWEKPDVFEGNSMKFKRNHLKSGYSRSVAGKLLQDLVNKLKCRIIVVSYNNTYNARSGASNNKIQESEIIKILQSKGEVKKIAIDYKGFNAGKTNFSNHQEYIFVCKVK